MRATNGRNAFTMIELLFVIVILGIVGGLALEAVRQYYDGIYRTQEYSKRAAEADAILEQISHYFENGIADSMVRLDKNAAPTGGSCDGPLDNTDSPNDEYTIGFISVDHDGLRGYWNATEGRYLPTWSPTVNVGSDVNVTASEADYSQANTMGSLSAATIYDKDRANSGTCADFAWGTTSATRYNDIVAYNATTLQLANKPMDGEDKYLLRTGYAFRAYNGEFRMYSNFQPWDGENYTAGGYKLLATKAAHFTVLYDVSNTAMNSTKGNVYTLKLCMFGLDEDLKDAKTSAKSEYQICRTRMVHARY